MDERIEKHLYDVLNAANEVEEFLRANLKSMKISVIADFFKEL